MRKQVQVLMVVLGGMLAAGCSQQAAAPAAEPAVDAAAQARALLTQSVDAAAAAEEAATLDGGENLNQMAEEKDARKLVMADTDKDGSEDAAVAVVTLKNVSTDYRETRLFGWRLVDGAWVSLDTSGVAVGPMGKVSADGDQLTTELLMHGPEDEACCPSVVDARTYTITADAIRDTSMDE